MSKAATRRIGDIVTFKRGYDLPASERLEGIFPVISSGGVSGYHSEFKKDGEGIITGRYGTLGEVYYIDGKYWPHNTTLYSTNFHGNIPKYVYYLMKCLGNLKTSDKSTVPGINRNDLHELVVPYIESKQTQKKIASVLSALDDKIELNNRINAELEAMAKTIYDYWFVQFDFPDANGKPYKSSGGKMVYNDVLKREVPEGWEAANLNRIANITMGQSPAGDSYNENNEGMIFFQGSTDFGWRFPTVRQFTTAPTRFAKQGDILLSVRAPVGTMNMADVDCCIGRGLAALHSNSGNDGFLFNTMLGLKVIFDRRNVDGTTFGSITKDDLHSLKIILPPTEIQEQYEQKVKPGNDIIFNNHKQNQHLSQLRDWLLPMLMNGQVSVADAYQQAAQALSMAAEDAAGYGKKR